MKRLLPITLVCVVILVLGANWVFVTLGMSALLESKASGIGVCTGLSASGVTLSFFTPLLVTALAFASLVLAVRDFWRSERRGLRQFAALVGSIAIAGYAVGFLTGVVPRPPKHPCLRSELGGAEGSWGLAELC